MNGLLTKLPVNAVFCVVLYFVTTVSFADTEPTVITENTEELNSETLYGDAEKFFKALTYVVDNAVKFTNEGGVTITARNAPHEQTNKVRLYVTIEDTGIGIESRPGRDIYQAFQQLDGSSHRAYGGLGLGLSVCRQLLHLLGGTVSHTSRPEGGVLLNLASPITLNLIKKLSVYRSRLFPYDQLLIPSPLNQRHLFQGRSC